MAPLKHEAHLRRAVNGTNPEHRKGSGRRPESVTRSLPMSPAEFAAVSFCRGVRRRNANPPNSMPDTSFCKEHGSAQRIFNASPQERGAQHWTPADQYEDPPGTRPLLPFDEAQDRERGPKVRCRTASPARHRRVNLTMRYTHTQIEDKVRALDGLTPVKPGETR